jgi:hypothetical protein
MLRSARLVTMVLIAMFVVAVPAAVAQSPVGDQYAVPSDTRAAPGAAGGGSGAAPVQVRELTADKSGTLPFTGGQISLIALIGLSLIAVGAVGLASSRRRTSTATI